MYPPVAPSFRRPSLHSVSSVLVIYQFNLVFHPLPDDTLIPLPRMCYLHHQGPYFPPEHIHRISWVICVEILGLLGPSGGTQLNPVSISTSMAQTFGCDDLTSEFRGRSVFRESA